MLRGWGEEFGRGCPFATAETLHPMFPGRRGSSEMAKGSGAGFSLSKMESYESRCLLI
jgi:hypothetical protein